MNIYKHPIPSRVEILFHIEKKNIPVSLINLYDYFNITSKLHKSALKKTLADMIKDGQIKINRNNKYQISRISNKLVGNVKSHKDGYGFLQTQDTAEDIFIDSLLMSQLFDGDEIAVSVSTGKKGKFVSSLLKIIKRSEKKIIGEIFRIKDIFFISPRNNAQKNIKIEKNKNLGANVGDLVEVTISKLPTIKQEPLAEVKRIIGRYDDPGIQMKSIIISHDIPYKWNEGISHQIKNFTNNLTNEDKRKRKDLRKKAFITIDGDDSKDFDDAVYCENMKDTYKLIVAIADVAHYVKYGSFIDKEAVSRGTSVYFPNRVIPMLPEKLSNDLCSLMPNVDRLVLCCEMIFSKNGNIIKSRFYEGLIRSKARLTYEVANESLQNKKNKLNSIVMEQLLALNQLYLSLDRKRRKRKAIDFDSEDIKYYFDSSGDISDIRPEKRLSSHKLIEECMIAANIEAAKYLIRNKIPTPFRVHEPPDQRSLDDFYFSLKSLGIDLSFIKKLNKINFTTTLEKISKLINKNILKDITLRVLNRAEYKSKNIGHFGLAVDQYTHFTSPIRRYPDLLVHRAIKYLIKHGNPNNYIYSKGDIENISKQSSFNERRADEATWEMEDYMKCTFLSRYIGSTYVGYITSVTKFGFFVNIKNFQIDGLVHISSLLPDVFKLDYSKLKLINKKNKKSYVIGQRVRVKIVSILEDQCKISLAIC